jgi:hypothetical protein
MTGRQGLAVTWLLVLGLLTACASTYQVPAGAPSASIRFSTGGKTSYSAYTFKDARTCNFLERQTLAGGMFTNNASDVTATIEAGSLQTIMFSVQVGQPTLTRGSTECDVVFSFVPEVGTRYAATFSYAPYDTKGCQIQFVSEDPTTGTTTPVKSAIARSWPRTNEIGPRRCRDEMSSAGEK